MEKTNKLIAEFMGNGKEYEIDINTKTLKSYHTSWDWLMPVIHKCFDVAEDGQMADIMHYLQMDEMDSIYKAVVEFIKNQNK